MQNSEIDQIALARDSLAVDQVHFGFLEGRGNLVLDHLDFCTVTDRLIAILQSRPAPHFQPDGSIEFQSAASGGCLRVAEHHADLFAKLIDEDETCVGAGYMAGEFTERL